MNGSKSLILLSLTVSSTSKNYETSVWCPTRPEEMEDLAAFNAKRKKRSSREKKELLLCRISLIYSQAPINSRLNLVVRSPTPLGWDKKAVGLPEGPRYPELVPLSVSSSDIPLGMSRNQARTSWSDNDFL